MKIKNLNEDLEKKIKNLQDLQKETLKTAIKEKDNFMFGKSEGLEISIKNLQDLKRKNS